MATLLSDAGTPVRPVLEARLLGQCVFHYNEREAPSDAFSRRQSRLLLLWLLLTPGHVLPRSATGLALWPNPAADADGSLRKALTAIRPALGAVANDPQIVGRTADTIFLNPDIDPRLDCDQFQAAAEAALRDPRDPAALRAAAALYTGPLLPTFVEDRLIAERRAALAARHRRVRLALAALEADPLEVMEHLRAVLQWEPDHEEATRRLIEVLHRVGRRAEALDAYEHLARALAAGGLAPSPETRRLRQRLLAGTPRALEVPSDPASLGTPDAARTNLPAAMTSFIGRAGEIAAIESLFAEPIRVLTLTGVGGSGKTRLGLEVAARVVHRYPHGIWLVELASLDDPRLVAAAIARTFGISSWQNDRSLVATLIEHLRDRSMMLLLDNCEHLAAACREVIGALLRGCPALVVVATSRHALHVEGERLWEVPPLSLPPMDHTDVETLPAADAARLFVQRATVAWPAFAVTAANAGTVAAICRALDGIPLAIELAAARLRLLRDVDELARRLHDRFRLLTGGDPAIRPRHQTLRATMDWSYELLDDPERLLLQRLSIFRGGWTLAAAEAVCADQIVSGSAVGTAAGDAARSSNGHEAGIQRAAPAAADGSVAGADLLDLLAALRDKSLVVDLDQDEGRPRYGLLETVREYAMERLTASGALPALRTQHRDWCLALAAEPVSGRIARTYVARLDTLEREHDNLRAALVSHAPDDAWPILRLAELLWDFWEIRGYLDEGLRTLQAALDRDPHAPAHLRAPTLLGAGHLAVARGDHEAAITHLAESMILFEALGDERSRGRVFHFQAFEALIGGNIARAIACNQRSLAISRETGDRMCLAEGMSDLAIALFFRGAFDQTLPPEEAKATLDYALGLAEEAVQVRGSLNDPLGMVFMHWNRGVIAFYSQNLPLASASLGESLRTAQRMRHQPAIANGIDCLAVIALVSERPDDAARLFAATSTIRARHHAERGAAYEQIYQQQLGAIREALGADAVAQMWAEGDALPLPDAISLALRYAGPE